MPAVRRISSASSGSRGCRVVFIPLASAICSWSPSCREPSPIRRPSAIVLGRDGNRTPSVIVVAMNTMNRAFRLLSLVLIVTLIIGFATPGRAEAIEPLTIVAIAGIGVIVIGVIAYMHESQKKSVHGEPRYLACVDSDVSPGNCWAISELPGPVAGLAASSVEIARAATQSP